MARLFFYVPALGGRLDEWELLRARLAREPACAGDQFQHWPLRPDQHPGRWSVGRLETYATALEARLAECDEAATARGEPYDEIVLIASSIGALLARWAWLDAAGAFSGEAPAPWAARVSRIVLAAGLNRGYSTRLTTGRRTVRNVATKVLMSLAGPVGFAWKDALAGSAFVTNLRLTWMRYMAEHPDRQPQVVQLLGTDDTIVDREDSRDIEQFPRAAHVSVPSATHSDILDLSGSDGDDRYLLLRSRILEPSQSTDPPLPPQAGATDVVFVVHGIRAGVYGWVTDVADRIEAAGGPNWRVVRPTYRYFSALDFAVPITRHRKVRWFLDQYSREVAAHLGATFHFAGHSNGTYLLGRALCQVPAVRFDRVYLAGSVLPATYPWHRYLDDGPRGPRIKVIRSDRGIRDLPVALLSKGLGGLGMHDIGDGGFSGFAELDAPPAIQWPYFNGGHGSPMKHPKDRKDIAAYITTGVAVKPAGLIDSSGGALAVLSRFSPLLMLGLAAGVVAVGVSAITAPAIWSIATIALIAAAVVALAFV